MPRNSAGVYTLPAGNPVTPFTIISTSWANPTMSDLGNEITNSLDRSGRGDMLASLRIIDGTVTFPGLLFSQDTNNGLWRAGTDDWRAVAGGVSVQAYTALGVKTSFIPGSPSELSYHFLADPDTGAYSNVAGIVHHLCNGIDILTLDGVAEAATVRNQVTALGAAATISAVLSAKNSAANTLQVSKLGPSHATLPNYGILRNTVGELVISNATDSANILFQVTAANTEAARITALGELLLGTTTNTGAARLRVNNSISYVSETVISPTTGAATVNFKDGAKQKVTLTGSWTPTFVFPGVGAYQVVIVSGVNNVTWPTIGATWQWVGSATAPTLNTGTYGGVLNLYNNGTMTIASYNAIGA